MISDWQEHQEQQAAAFAAVHDAFVDGRIAIRTAGQLAKLMQRLPADTPITVASSTLMDPRPPDRTKRRTITTAKAIPLEDPDKIIHVNDGGVVRRFAAVTPAVELAAVIVAHDALGAPPLAVPAPAYERAVDALRSGEPCVALDKQVELLRWMASTLDITDPADFDDEVDHVLTWIDNTDLLAALDVEGGRLRQAAARLAALRARVADYEIVANVTFDAEEIVRNAAEYPPPDEEGPSSTP
ncbi:hypothetical protein MED01_006113 [Micromonospora sp. MED01]|uniref:hypothetical protein n=1 Tax=Micromonospora alfalfae TaxID=2911212 RepID=UPI001EE8CD54|nr:hypothetical protein [Micromonospora alfalfae]MCG5467061.1 hypothetical protein [Micromonospora alfalfae]